MIEVNKGELAKHIGKSGATVSNLITKGILNNCFSPGGRIYLEKAVKAITLAKGDDYIEASKVKEQAPINQIKITPTQYNSFITNFSEDMFDLESADDEDKESFIDNIERINHDNIILRDLADYYGLKVYVYAFDFAMDIKDVESFFNVKAK